MSAWQLYTDGASRNNPGAAGAGIYLLKDGVPAEKVSAYLGFKTNNQAEYLAMLLGILYAVKHIKNSNEKLILKSDSELLVKQIKGIYTVTNPILKKIYSAVKNNLANLNYEIVHIPREENTIADKLANKAIDEKIAIKSEILPIWQLYENFD